MPRMEASEEVVKEIPPNMSISATPKTSSLTVHLDAIISSPLGIGRAIDPVALLMPAP